MNEYNKTLGINGVKLKNFKAFAEVDLELANLNYILGENSVGKSSLSQALVLLAQNLRDTKGTTFRLNGSVMRLGSLQQIARSQSREEVAIEVKVHYLPVDGWSESGWPEFQSSTIRVELDSDLITKNQSIKGNSSTVDIARFDYSDTRYALDISNAKVIGEKLESPAVARRSFVRLISPTGPTSRGLILLPANGDLPSIVAVGVFDDQAIASNIFQREPDDPRDISNLEFVDGGTIEVLEEQYRSITSAARPSEEDQVHLTVSFADLLVIAAADLHPGSEDIVWDQIDIRKLIKNVSLGNHFSLPQKLRASNLIDELPISTDLWEFLQESNKNNWDRFVLSLRSEDGNFLENLGWLALYFAEIGQAPDNFWDSDLELGEKLVQLNTRVSRSSRFFYDNLHYLGPLRGDGYSRQANDSIPDSLAPVGVHGELMVQAIVDRQRGDSGQFQKLIDWVSIQKNQHEKYPLPDGQATGGFLLALNAWIGKLGLGTQLTFRDLGVHGFEVLLDGKNLYHLGTGVSQILPVLVVCLVAKPGSLTILEQPELHLHPAAQQGLADFFLTIAQSGRRLLVETHSEYIINRTRRSVVMGTAESSDVKLIFAESGEFGSTIREASLTGSGGFSYWPKGFFAQTEDDLMDIIRAINEDN